MELGREVSRARRTGQTLVLAFVDVVGLKAVNDSCGHARGDEVLRVVADSLRAHLRPYDVVVRYGGDEFVCVLAGLELFEAARRLAAVNADLADRPERTSVTIGLSELGGAEDSLERLIGRADDALYRQRHQGGRSGLRSGEVLDQSRRDAGLSQFDLWLRYFEFGGMANPPELEAYLLGVLQPSPREHDLLVHALDERFAELGRARTAP